MVNVPDFGGLHACNGQASLFDDTHKRRDAERQAVCNRCPVIPECLAHALLHEPVGYWAGHNPGDRGRLRAKYGIRPLFDVHGRPRSDLKEAA